MRKTSFGSNKCYVQLGKLIKTNRNLLGLSQQELANFCDLSRVTICAIESGKQGIELYNVLKIMAKLKMPLSSLLEIFGEIS